jgi:Zn-dependent M28 family amino/carboxypeptidase
MLRTKTFLTFHGLTFDPPTSSRLTKILPMMILLASMGAAADFSGVSAMKYTREAVAFGPRPAGSEANHKLQNYILSQIRQDGCQVIEDPFVAKTPFGDKMMDNIIAKFPGRSGRAIVITGHFDTKPFPGRKFVGANDGGSSTGLLLELARVLSRKPRIDDVYLVWFDGEEAFRPEWAGLDNLYGSRHLAAKWRQDQTLTRIKALINVDMIGDKSLNIKRETNSNPRLLQLVWSTAAELGYQAYFVNENLATDDDHMPFVQLGVPALDIIDFDYPPWHEDSDTLDKLSSQSLEIVGTVVLEVIHRLEIQ